MGDNSHCCFIFSRWTPRYLYNCTTSCPPMETAAIGFWCSILLSNIGHVSSSISSLEDSQSTQWLPAESTRCGQKHRYSQFNQVTTPTLDDIHGHKISNADSRGPLKVSSVWNCCKLAAELNFSYLNFSHIHPLSQNNNYVNSTLYSTLKLIWAFKMLTINSENEKKIPNHYSFIRERASCPQTANLQTHFQYTVWTSRS